MGNTWNLISEIPIVIAITAGIWEVEVVCLELASFNCGSFQPYLPGTSLGRGLLRSTSRVWGFTV